jgi:hypothetical protein
MKFSVYTEPEILRQSVQWQRACVVYINYNIQITGIGVWGMDQAEIMGEQARAEEVQAYNCMRFTTQFQLNFLAKAGAVERGRRHD